MREEDRSQLIVLCRLQALAEPKQQPVSACAIFPAGLISGHIVGKRKRTESPIEYVFHGTDHNNLDSILQKGMDPKRRHKSYDYFASDPGYPLMFTGLIESQIEEGESGDLLLFLVLTLPPGFFGHRDSDIVVMEKVEYELPICVATVRKLITDN